MPPARAPVVVHLGDERDRADDPLHPRGRARWCYCLGDKAIAASLLDYLVVVDSGYDKCESIAGTKRLSRRFRVRRS